jgi:hypothetical protein
MLIVCPPSLFVGQKQVEVAGVRTPGEEEKKDK